MASKPLDTYIKTPPPSNPASKETYLEQQLGSIERVLQKHTNTIEENYANNVASILEEKGVRVTADSALAYTLQQLTATVDVNNTQTQAQITNLQTAAADAATATATQLQTLTAKVDTNLGSTNAAISNEQKARATADSALASKISSLTASVDYSNTQTSASIRNEATVRATADSALATTIQTLEAKVDTNLTNTNAAITTEATARATADTAETTARQSLQSFVGWDGGSYSSNLVQTMGTKVSKTDGASYEWSVQGTIDGATGGLRLTGAKRLNPNTNAVETTANLIIDANTRINGDLLVTGTVAAARLATIPGSKLLSNTDGTGDLVDTDNLRNNSVSNSTGVTVSGINATVNITLKAGARVAVIATSAAGGSSGGPFSGSLRVDVQPPIGTASNVGILGITSFVESTAFNTYSYNGYLTAAAFAASSKLPNATLLGFYQAPTGSGYTGTYTFNAQNTNSPTTSILVIGLSK